MNGRNASGAGVLLIGVDACLEKFKTFLAEMGFAGRISPDAATSHDFALGVLPKIIIVGTKVPPFDGAAMVEMLRSEKRLSTVPILLLSEERRRSAAADPGADETLPLSVEPLALYDAVLRWAARGASDSAAAPAASAASVRPAAPSAKGAAEPKTVGGRDGELRPGTILKLIYQLSQEPGDFVLAVKMQWAKLKIKIRGGKIVNVASSHIPTVSLGALLASEGRITPAEGEAAYVKAHNIGMRQGEMLVKLGVLDDAALSAAICRQKRLKLRYLLAHPKLEGEYAVRDADPAAKNVLPLDLPAAPFLFDMVVNELPLRNVTDTLAGLTDLQGRIEFADEASDALRKLKCPDEFLDAARFLQGKTLAEIRGESPTPDEERWLKFVYLMTALECVRFTPGERAPEPAAAPPPPPIPPVPRAAAPPPPFKPKAAPAAPKVKFVMPPEAAENLRIARELIYERRFAEAGAALRIASQMAPTSAEIAAVWAWSDFSSLVHYDERIVDPIQRRLEKAIQTDPTNEWAHLYLGKLLKAKKEEDAATSHFLAALSINPNNEETQREVKLAQIKERTRRGFGIHA